VPDSPARAAAIDAAASMMRDAFNAGEGSWRELAAIAFDECERSLEIVGKREAAELFGKSPTNLGRDVPELPAPDWTLKATPVWRRHIIQATVDARAAATVEG
jgi:hypothetical protein